jgi:two-component sensor histidine kinase
MADRASDRQHKLENSLADNRALMLEMHHRIKNSLQVVQSYLALIRRNGPRSEALLLARIEARVGVLAIAYRLALTPQGMRPISIKPFVEEIFAATTGGLRRPRQRVTSHIGWDGELVVDRAIPLGLALVEAMIAAFDAPEITQLAVALARDAEGAVEISVDADAAPAASGLPEKVMRGLAAQLGATSAPPAQGNILKWRFVR